MRITHESDYALRILTTIALNNGLIDAKSISEMTSVTPRFALKILNKLVKGGLIRSVKGARGGYDLAVSVHQITLKQVIELIDGPIAIASCVDTSEACSLNCDKTACVYHHIFDGVSASIARQLDSISISDVIAKINKKEKS